MIFKGTPRLETERLILRKIDKNDYKIAYEQWCSNLEQVIYKVHGIHKNEEVTRRVYDRWIEEYNDEKTMRWIIELKENSYHRSKWKWSNSRFKCQKDIFSRKEKIEIYNMMKKEWNI